MAIAGLALALAACGDSDSGDSGGGGSSADVAATTERQPETTTDREPATPKPKPKGEKRPSGGSGGGQGGPGGDPRAPADTGDDQGSDGSDGGDAEISAAVTKMYSALAAGNAPTVCAGLTKAARAQVSGQSGMSCDQAFSKIFQRAGGGFEQVGTPQVGAIEIDGPIARVTVTLNGRGGKIKLLEEEGAWRFGAEAVAPRPG